jgi:hypothetical protein
MHWHSVAGTEVCAFIVGQNLRNFVVRKNHSCRPSPINKVVCPTSATFCSLASSSAAGEEEASEEDLLRWEQMYYQAGKQSIYYPSTSLAASWKDVLDPSSMAASAAAATTTINQQQRLNQVRVVSFDLDNTIWKTSATIDAANDALAAFLDQHNIQQTRRVEKVMGDLFKSNKARYCPIDTESSKGPVLLTLL